MRFQVWPKVMKSEWVMKCFKSIFRSQIANEICRLQTSHILLTPIVFHNIRRWNIRWLIRWCHVYCFIHHVIQCNCKFKICLRLPRIDLLGMQSHKYFDILTWPEQNQLGSPFLTHDHMYTQWHLDLIFLHLDSPYRFVLPYLSNKLKTPGEKP